MKPYPVSFAMRLAFPVMLLLKCQLCPVPRLVRDATGLPCDAAPEVPAVPRACRATRRLPGQPSHGYFNGCVRGWLGGLPFWDAGDIMLVARRHHLHDGHGFRGWYHWKRGDVDKR